MTSDKLQLPQVTLFGIDAHNPQGLLRAAEICQREIDFGAVVIITERLFPGSTREEGRTNYSAFMIKRLTEFFTTSHVLTIHDDGYIQNPKAWRDEWLELSYLGSPWEWLPDRQCGNGGFSLRSKELCDILAADPLIEPRHPEDETIARIHHDYLVEKYGIKFGTLQQAREFGIEGWNTPHEHRRYKGQFGFHGHHPYDLPFPIKK